MIAKAKATSNMRLFHYLMGQDKDFELLPSYFIVGDTPDEIVQEITEIGRLRPLKNPLLHIILSLDKADSDRDFTPLVEQFVERLGVQGCQSVAVVHFERTSETRGAHCHLVVNRVSLAWRVVSDKMIGIRVRDIARKMNVELGLRNEYDKSNRRDHSYAKNRYFSPRKAEVLERLRAICQREIEQSRSVKNFGDRLRQKGVAIEVVRSKKGDRIVGHRFIFENYSYKASEVGRCYAVRAVRTFFAARALSGAEIGVSPRAGQAVKAVGAHQPRPGGILRDIGRLAQVQPTPQEKETGKDEDEQYLWL